MATEKRLDLIDRKDLIKAVEKKQIAIADNTHPDEAIRIQGKYFREVVDNAPTVDAVEVVHGRWIRVHEWCGVEVFRCSACGREHPRLKTKYCCDCGAKMDGGNEDG